MGCSEIQHPLPFCGFMFTSILVSKYFFFLLPREEEQDGVRRRPKPRDSSIEEREKILAELDPEVLDYLFDYFGW